MLGEGKKEEKNKKLLNALLKELEKKGFEKIRADIEHETYERPTPMRAVNSDLELVPDATAFQADRKIYFEIADKNAAQRELITKWKLLSRIAAMKNGQLRIMMPRGTMKFTRELVAEHQITAELIPM